MDKLSFALEKFDLMEISQEEIMKVKMYIVKEGNNHHNKPISWETILKARDTLVGKPIVAKFDKWKNDLEGHEIDEVPVGVILKDEDIFEEVDENGDRWLCAIGDIWVRYAQDVAGVLVRDKIKELSMEIIVLESGIEDCILTFVFSGITLIGIDPAIPNARAEVLSFEKVKDEIEHILFSKANEVMFDIPDIVRSNSEKGLAQYKKNKKGGTAIAVSVANALSFEQKANKDLINKINKFATDKSNVMFWGGKEGLLWAKECLDILKKEEGEKMSVKKEKDVIDKTKENFESKEEVEMGCGDVKMEEDVEKKDEKMTSDSYVENSAIEQNQEVVGEEQREQAEEENKPEMMEIEKSKLEYYVQMEKDFEDMKAQFEAEKEDKDAFMSEFSRLKKFESDYNETKFNSMVEATFAEVDGMPLDEVNKFRDSAKSFTLENISDWKNQVFATAYTYSRGKGKEKTIKIDIMRDVEPKKSKGLWD